MIDTTNAHPDYLNAVGQAILKADTRWVVVGAAIFVVIFYLAFRYKKKRGMSRDDAQSLGLALLQLYSAPVLFCLLVLTQPPAVDLVGNFQRQGAGLLAFIFLVAGVFVQIEKIWTDGSKPPNEQSHSSSADAKSVK